MEASGSPSLVLVEQHEALRDGLAVLLERRGFEVRGCATTATSGEELISELRPDVAVVGVDLPDERGTELVRRLNDRPPCPKFLIYTGLTDPDLLEAAYRSGARGLVAKPAGLDVLVDALREVWRGGRYFDRSFAANGTNGNGNGAGKTLSRRESEILTLLAQGLTGEEIAKRLVLSPETVRTHIRNAMEKLDARTRTEAVVKALDREEIQR
ncbi:MAG TPA: response regulator transcription factor [Solirubrobacterales bacterium]|jgi:DNA-binding NarL/FixJ family response regulator|nr:response regulator transcription factor [Solirubrobacterales bacterium]